MSKGRNKELADALLSQAIPESGIISAMQDVLAGVEIDKPRWDYWRQVGYLKIWEAILLSCGRDPMWRASGERFTQSQSAVWGALSSLTNGNAAERLDVARSRIGVDLPVLAVDPAKPARSPIELVKFVIWATALGWNIPTELGEIAASSGQANALENQSKPMTNRERATLLIIIAAMAKEQGIDISKSSKAAGMIEDMTERLGVKLSLRAIEEHLKRIPETLEKRSTP